MKKTLKIKLMPTKEQRVILDAMCLEYINTVNMLTSEVESSKELSKCTTKEFYAKLPSAVKNQCLRDAKSILKKQEKSVTETLAVLKKPVCIWNNQNFSVTESTISFPVWLGKSVKIQVDAIIPIEYMTILQSKLGTLRITKKSHKYIAQITYEAKERTSVGTAIMGVDLGIKVPAVCALSNGKIKFIGNGRENKVIRRKFKSKRKILGKAKKLNAIKSLKDKEQRIMQDRDHKYSREIVNLAVANNVSVIRLEKLTNIRNATRKSRKNNRSLHTWSFYRLSQFIEYKAAMVGITVQYVDPAYTSQHCPYCGTINKAKDRAYYCKECNTKTHRDIVGAKNIMSMAHGNSVSA